MTWMSLSSLLSTAHFVWPWMLLGLLLLPVWWWFYAYTLVKRIRQRALNFSYASVVARLQTRSGWKRLLYPLSVCAVLTCLMISLARPVVTMRVPVHAADVMLVLDISLSMMAEDLKPTRLDAAKRAAADFVKGLPEGIRVGLTVFAGEVYVLSPPTRDHQEVISDLKALRVADLKPRTEIGSALHIALRSLKRQSLQKANSKTGTSKPRSGKGNSDRAIILLSDGDSHEGYPWQRASEDAVRAGVTIDTIGIGSEQGSSITYQGMVLPVAFDEGTLREIATIANGHYFRVHREKDFAAAYQQIQARTLRQEEKEVGLSYIFAGLALFFLLLALGISAREGL